MNSRDRFLLEKAYHGILNETPDGVRDPVTKEFIDFKTDGAYTFGFLSCVEERIAPIWWGENTFLSLKGFPEDFIDKLYVSDKKTHQEMFKTVVSEDIFNASQGIITLITPKQKKVFDISSNLDIDEESELIKILQEDYNARHLLFPAGRIWTKHKIISFWTKEGDVTESQLNKIFNYFNITKEEASNFYIEFLGDRMPTKTVHDYTTGTKREYTKEEEKQAAEDLAKAHVAAAGAKDTGVKDILDKRKAAGIEADTEARLSGKKPDLKTRQLSQTSESFINNILKSNDQIILEKIYSSIYNLEEGVHDPHIFKAVFMIGPMGAGKSYIANKLVGGTGLRSLNLDNFNELMIRKGEVPGGNLSEDQLYKNWKKLQKQRSTYIEGRLGLLIDGSGRNIHNLKEKLKQVTNLGYDAICVFVNVSPESSIERAAERAKRQSSIYGVGRNVPEELIRSTYNQIQGNLEEIKNLFCAENFIEIDNTNTPDLKMAQKQINKFLNASPSKQAAVNWIEQNK